MLRKYQKLLCALLAAFKRVTLNPLLLKQHLPYFLSRFKYTFQSTKRKKHISFLCFALLIIVTIAGMLLTNYDEASGIGVDYFGKWCNRSSDNDSALSAVNYTNCIRHDKKGFIFPKVLPVDVMWLCDETTSSQSRVIFFNDAMTAYRKQTIIKFVKKFELHNSYQPDKVTTEIVYEYGMQYFQQLRQQFNDTRITSIFMRWIGDECSPVDNTTRNNLLITRFYRWTGVKPPCDWWDATQVFLFDSAYCQPYSVFKHKNKIPMKNILNDNGTALMDYTVLNKYDRSVDDASNLRYSFFAHVIIDGVITPAGDVVIGLTKITSNGCAPDNQIWNGTKEYDEVFAASQVWAVHSFYHLIIEGLTKMAIMLKFLRDNPSIRVHVAKRSRQVEQVFEVLGLNPERIVTGHSRGKVVYWPRPTNCYEAPLPDLQIIAEEYKRYIVSTSNDVSRNSVVYIRRIHDRRFERNDEIEKQTQQISEKYGLRFELFPEDPQLSLNETMYMFYRAKVIVAPHGAGLLNMQYCRRATIIVEAIDNLSNCPCFLLMAHTLGHRYHAVGATGGRTIVRVNVKEFINSVEFHIKYAAEHPESFRD